MDQIEEALKRLGNYECEGQLSIEDIKEGSARNGKEQQTYKFTAANSEPKQGRERQSGSR